MPSPIRIKFARCVTQREPHFQGIIPPELVSALRTNRCILLAGAGISAQVTRSTGAALPTWSQFLLEMLEWAISHGIRFWGDPEDIRDMIARGDLLAAAQELQDRLEAAELATFLHQVFHDSGVVPSASHRLLPHIPFRAVLTTNYDSLIEGAYSIERGGHIPPVFTQEDLSSQPSPLRRPDFFVFKVHGHQDRPDSIVLGSHSYQNLLFRTPGYRQFLETLFATHTVLFMGFGGTDPDLDNVIDRLASIYSRTLDRHFILLPAGRLNPTEKRRYALDRRLEVIEYHADNTHSQIIEFLRELAVQVERKRTRVTQAVGGKPIKVFISGSMQDAHVINRLKGLLREHGYSLATVDQEVNVASEIRQSISEAIAAADVVVVVFSEHSIRREWIRYETEFAVLREVEGRTIVVPVVIGGVLPPTYLQGRVYLRLGPDFSETELSPLLKILERIRRERQAGGPDLRDFNE